MPSTFRGLFMFVLSALIVSIVGNAILYRVPALKRLVLGA